MLDAPPRLGNEPYGNNVIRTALERGVGARLVSVRFRGPPADGAAVGEKDQYDWGVDDRRAVVVHWVTEYRGGSALRTPCVGHGNEAVLQYVYMSFCLFVEVGPPGQRDKRGVQRRRSWSIYV